MKPVAHTRTAGLPLPRRADPHLVEHRGHRVAVVARQVDVDLGDLAPISPWQSQSVDLFAADYPGVWIGQRVVETSTTVAPSAMKSVWRVTTTFLRFGNGRNRTGSESQVRRPITAV